MRSLSQDADAVYIDIDISFVMALYLYLYKYTYIYISINYTLQACACRRLDRGARDWLLNGSCMPKIVQQPFIYLFALEIT